jgi:hypothetical protein
MGQLRSAISTPDLGKPPQPIENNEIAERLRRDTEARVQASRKLIEATKQALERKRSA